MAITNFGNDPLAGNLRPKSIDVEAPKHKDIFPLTGDNANSVIHRKTETRTPQNEFSAPQAAIRAELVADDSCCALGMTVRGPAPDWSKQGMIRQHRLARRRPLPSNPVDRCGRRASDWHP